MTITSSFADGDFNRINHLADGVSRVYARILGGGTISPAIFDTLAILGRQSVLNRIERCLATRQQQEQP